MTPIGFSALELVFIVALYVLCVCALFIPKWNYDADSFPGTGSLIGTSAASAGMLILSAVNTIRWILREDAFWAMVHLPLVILFTIVLTKAVGELQRARKSEFNQPNALQSD